MVSEAPLNFGINLGQKQFYKVTDRISKVLQKYILMWQSASVEVSSLDLVITCFYYYPFSIIRVSESDLIENFSYRSFPSNACLSFKKFSTDLFLYLIIIMIIYLLIYPIIFICIIGHLFRKYTYELFTQVVLKI